MKQILRLMFHPLSCIPDVLLRDSHRKIIISCFLASYGVYVSHKTTYFHAKFTWMGALMAVQLNTTVSDFIRVCDKLLIVPRPALTPEELDILDGYIAELIEKFLSSPKPA